MDALSLNSDRVELTVESRVIGLINYDEFPEGLAAWLHDLRLYVANRFAFISSTHPLC